jgi:hypothetical protein
MADLLIRSPNNLESTRFPWYLRTCIARSDVVCLIPLRLDRQTFVDEVPLLVPCSTAGAPAYDLPGVHIIFLPQTSADHAIDVVEGSCGILCKIDIIASIIFVTGSYTLPSRTQHP